MKPETYDALLKDLQKLQKNLVASQIDAGRRDPTFAARLTRLHAEAEVGGPFDDFVATAARKSTVLFLLRSVFVRVLEDLGILGLKRIRDDWGFAAFRELAPALGLRSYFAFTFRDLAVDFPGLFCPGDDELPLPSEDDCRAVWNLWHHPNRDGEHYVWNDDAFDSRFLGDLYEDLDHDIRKRYALRQTPRFVEEYILGRTLTPALEEFDPATLRGSGDTFRVLDPTCGSGHFLIGAFHRLADYWRDRHGLAEWTASERALEGVWGCDINPHAVEIAEFRLLLEVVSRTGVKDLSRLAVLKLNLRTMDSLIPWERTVVQEELFPAKLRLDAYATSKQRQENATFLGGRFQVVVGNPPYIAPKDTAKKADYRSFWPDSARGRYALSAPFVERFFSLAAPGAAVGMINSNNFVTDEFGRGVVEKVIRKHCITEVVDTQFAAIPGHGMKGGTATLMLFGRNRPPGDSPVKMVLGKRGESRRTEPQGEGLVWASIMQARLHEQFENEYISVEQSPQSRLHSHPWVLGGGLTSDILMAMQESNNPLSSCGGKFGYLTKPVEDDVYIPAPTWIQRRFGALTVPMLEGGNIRDWSVTNSDQCIHPHDWTTGAPLSLTKNDALYRYLWGFRTLLWHRKSRATGFAPLYTIPGAKFYEFPFYYPQGLSETFICTPYKYTVNHFALVHPPHLFKQTVRALRVPDEQRSGLLALLNSSCIGFWIRAKSGGTGQSSELWMDRRDVNQSVLEGIPLVSLGATGVELARALDAAAQARKACLPGTILASNRWQPSSLAQQLMDAGRRYVALTHRMVALQEELDWLTYKAYGLIESLPTVDPDGIEPLVPGHRPFEIVLARADSEADEDEKSAWWSRNGHERVTEIPESYSHAHRARLLERIDLIESEPRLMVLETPANKRRWPRADWPIETKKAAEAWLLDRLEDLFAPATDKAPGGPLTEPKAYRLEDIVIAWSRDVRVAAVAGVWTGTGLSVDLTLVAERLLRANALPDNPHRVYSDEGMRKLAEWKRTWVLQDQEDVLEATTGYADRPAQPLPKKRLVDPDDSTKEFDAVPLPRKFDKGDFSKAEFFSIRGKLNVSRERFILFADLSPNRFGWNGWRDRERALAQVEAFTLAENDPQLPLPPPTPDEPRRCGVTFGLWESLPEVRRWGTAEEHAELQALAREACRQPRCPCPVIDAWKSKVLQGTATPEEDSPKPKAGGKSKPQTVSLAERAWVASLFQPGKELDAAGVWAQHLVRLGGPSQLSMPGMDRAPVQLTMHMVSNEAADEQASLDEAQLGRVLDDLVASGDLQAAGRGKKKRFQLVTRRSST